MLKFIFIINILLFSFHANAQTRAKIGMKDGTNRTLQYGEVFEGEISIHPTNTSYYNDLLRLEGKIILEGIFISEITDIKLSPYNSEVILAHWRGVVFKPIAPQKLKLGQQEIEISQMNLILEDGEPQVPKGFSLLEQKEVPKEFEWKLWMTILVLLFIVISLVLYKLWKTRKVKREKEEKKKERIESWLRLFNRASEFEDLVKIYQQREEWLMTIEYDPKLYSEFRHRINQVQFKKDQLEEDIQFVTESYMKLKKDIEQRNGI